MAGNNLASRIVISLLIAAGILECAICVAAYSRGFHRGVTASAQAKIDAAAALTQTEATCKDAKEQCDAAAKESADLKKQLERATDKLDEQGEKLAASEKEASRLRGELDAASTRIADLNRTLKDAEARIKRTETSLADAQDAEREAHRKLVALKDEKQVAVAPAPVVIEQVERGSKKHHKNGANQVAGKKKRGGVASLPRTTPSFSELDTNQDGRISYQEYKVGYPDATEDDFKTLDTNGDGSLSLDEYKAAHPDPGVVHVTRKKN